MIAHHYVVNSGLTTMFDFNHVSGNMIFLQLFGMFGKVGINCFTLITGYFMVGSKITVKKFLRLYLEVKFYYIVTYILFIVTGYEAFSIKGLIKTIFSVVYEAGYLYTGSYIIFFLFIPFLNILAKGLNKKQYQALIVLLFIYYTIFSTFFFTNTFNFIGWLTTVYFIGAYMRLHHFTSFSIKKVSYRTF